MAATEADLKAARKEITVVNTQLEHDAKTMLEQSARLETARVSLNCAAGQMKLVISDFQDAFVGLSSHERNIPGGIVGVFSPLINAVADREPDRVKAFRDVSRKMTSVCNYIESSQPGYRSQESVVNQ